MAGYARQGADLALTRFTGVPSAAPLPSADSWGSLDLRIARDLRGAVGIGTVSGRANLAQALTLRLLTEQGSLAALGHPDFGCRLVTLIGRLNDEATRHLARLFVIDAVRQEKRVKALTALSIVPAPGEPQSIRIEFTVAPVNDDDPLSLALDVAL